jgi:hypothetical protein
MSQQQNFNLNNVGASHGYGVQGRIAYMCCELSVIKEKPEFTASFASFSFAVFPACTLL